MTDPARHADRAPGVHARNRSRWRSVALPLGLLAATSLVLGLRGWPTSQAADTPAAHARVQASGAPSGPAAASKDSTQPAGARVASRPVHLSIPSLHLSTGLLRLGVHEDGTVQVPAPADADLAGWFRLGPTPGQVGSAVILGHVDSLSGPAVFYELRFLKPGARVDARLADGTVARFRVQRVRTYPNAEFPARKVYGSHGYPALQLVTCGGAYDERTGYQANVVVYTRLVHTTPATT